MQGLVYLFFLLMLSLALGLAAKEDQPLSYQTGRDRFRGFCEIVSIIFSLFYMVLEIEQLVRYNLFIYLFQSILKIMFKYLFLELLKKTMFFISDLIIFITWSKFKLRHQGISFRKVGQVSSQNLSCVDSLSYLQQNKWQIFFLSKCKTKFLRLMLHLNYFFSRNLMSFSFLHILCLNNVYF